MLCIYTQIYGIVNYIVSPFKTVAFLPARERIKASQHQNSNTTGESKCRLTSEGEICLEERTVLCEMFSRSQKESKAC